MESVTLRAAEEKLTAFVELESAIRKNSIALSVGGWQSRARASL